ncbi:MAG: hypothetical protein II027_02815, partial [Bacteroidales bacterium]|nr:hypothetical protein [Bacteroidales bacterium]
RFVRAKKCNFVATIRAKKCILIMKRLLFSDLSKWKNSNNRKPLILNGSCQVGKTWLLQNLKGIRFSMKPHIDQSWMENVPLYALETVM